MWTRYQNDQQSFNEAEARAPRMVQMIGRGLRKLDPASMRPRRVRLGWDDDAEHDRLAPLSASMRPRRVRLGWAAKRPCVVGSMKLLQ